VRRFIARTSTAQFSSTNLRDGVVTGNRPRSNQQPTNEENKVQCKVEAIEHVHMGRKGHQKF